MEIHRSVKSCTKKNIFCHQSAYVRLSAATKKKYRDYNIKLEKVVSTYGTMKKIEYLLMVASNIKYAI